MCVCERVVCDKSCVCVKKMSETKLCVTKLCVKELSETKLCVCDKLCVCVTKLCVKQNVRQNCV